MSTEYTPTTEEVRGDYANFQLPAGGGDFRDEYAEGLAEFDRWLAAHDREVAARALESAVDAFESGEVEHEHLKGRSTEAPKGWTDESIQAAFDSAGPIMDWLRARAQYLRTEGGQTDG